MKLFIVVLCLIFSGIAQADLEFRGTYQYSTISPTDLQLVDQAYVNSSFPKMSSMSGLGIDGIYYFPIINLGIGIRYEMYSNKVSGGVFDQTLSANRSALLVGYRLINSNIYLGALGSYGLFHDIKAKTSGGVSDLSTATQSSFSVGAEGGIMVGHLLLGAELGYMYFLGRDIVQGSTSLTSGGSKTNLDLSGVYVKALVGITY